MSDEEINSDGRSFGADEAELPGSYDTTCPIVPSARTTFVQAKEIRSGHLKAIYDCRSDDQGFRNASKIGTSEFCTISGRESKQAIVKYATVRNTLKPPASRTENLGKAGDVKNENSTKVQFDVSYNLMSDDVLEELRKQHPAAHVLTSIAAQVSANQALGAEDVSKALGNARNGSSGSTPTNNVIQGARYLSVSNSFSESNDATSRDDGLMENTSDPNIDDMQVIEYMVGDRDALPPASDANFCLVCGDKGSGFHYSIFSCEGCKGFFKRTVQKNMVYVCKDSGACCINKMTRNNCQACRFKKCLDVGMKKEAVREDRTPGGKHRLKRQRIEEPEMTAAVPNLSASHTDTIVRLVEARPDMIPTIEELSLGGRTEELDVDDLMHFGYLELRFIIEWAKKVPGFSDMVLEDQMALLKASFMELNLLRLAFRSLDCPGSIKFANEVVLSASQCVHMGWGHDLLNCILEFVSRLRNISIDSTEFCILNAVVLTYPDAAGIVDKPSVTSLQSQMVACLQSYSATRYPDDPRRYGLILLRLPALRTISAKAAEMFLSLSLEGNVKMNSLFIEMMQ